MGNASIGKLCNIDATVADSSDVDTVSCQVHVQFNFSSLQEISDLAETKLGQCSFNLIQRLQHPTKLQGS